MWNLASNIVNDYIDALEAVLTPDASTVCALGSNMELGRFDNMQGKYTHTLRRSGDAKCLQLSPYTQNFSRYARGLWDNQNSPKFAALV